MTPEDTATQLRSDPLPIPTGTQDRLEGALARLPFEAHLSFDALFAVLEQEGRPVPDVAALHGRVDDAALAAHPSTVRELMGHVIPELMDDDALVRVYAPFAPSAFFTTAKYRAVFGAEGVEISQANGMVKRQFYRENMLFAYRMLFHRHYDVPVSPPAFVKRIRDTQTGLDHFYMNEGSIRYVQVSYPGKTLLPKLEFKRLLDREDIDELERRLPLDGVTYSGFMFIRYVEITELHNVSLLKSELVEPQVLHRAERIRARMRSILRYDDLEIGMVLNYESRGGQFCNKRSLLSAFQGCMTSIGGSAYETVIASKTPLFVPDLHEIESDSAVVGHLRAQGFRSVGLIPLIEDGEVIAILEMGSPTPERINASASRKLADLLAPLAVAARREMDATTSAIATAIKTHCTAIHPSVEWRFEQAAYRYNTELAEKGVATFEPIVFEDVYPLFGAMDIRGSSASRNQAIEADLLEQLDLASETLRAIHSCHPMPLADYYDKALVSSRASVAKGLSSGDEISLIDFLLTRIEPFFHDVRKCVSLPKDEHGQDPVDRYLAHMDESLGILYRKRKQYEHSVSLINTTLATFVEQEQVKAQAIFPHYFEMAKTDGVEYSIYIGASMTQGDSFSDVQLQNLRLWQLTLMCDMARCAEGLVPLMEVPLRTTPLVLVQSSPLTIQFSLDEKQFAVEGSYNIRYAIIKQRIDKSTIRGTGERLTQPMHLAVIYSQDKERDEYERYLDYLVGKGTIEPEFERLELDDLQGVSGLRALRAKIRMRYPKP